MHIEIRNLKRERLFGVDVDLKNPASLVRPEDEDAQEVYLHWDGAIDDDQHLRRCPVCGCRELFVRKDFPQVTGLLIVVLAVVVSVVLWATWRVVWGYLVLALVTVIDAIVYFFAGRCLVCYRCRSEYRNLPIRADHPGWELATGEKYRGRSDEATERRSDGATKGGEKSRNQ